MKIYTKTGDQGDTRLFDGTRVRKDDERVDAYGSVDELNAFIGAAVSLLNETPGGVNAAEIAAMLTDIQRDLFSVGAQLADPRHGERSSSKFQLGADRVTALEEAIDRFESELPPLRQFILAGGCPAGAMLHVARTVCRRAERHVVSLSGAVAVPAGVIQYMNRLSDFLFVLARVVNHRQGQQEITW